MNRLTRERSPYLLAARRTIPSSGFRGATKRSRRRKRRDKPIFLSIGYSTCHWCHVMEHESFENERRRGVFNQHFVSIKVDREERPDVDRVYMTFVQATTGFGRVADERLADTGPEAFLWRHVLSADVAVGPAWLRDILQEIARVWSADRDKVAALGRSR